MKKSISTCLLLLVMLTGCNRQEDQPPPVPAKGAAKPATAAVPPAGALPSTPPPAPGLPPSAVAVPTLLRQPLPADFVEMSGDALPIWRQYRHQRPTLVIFSPEPMLMGIAPEVNEQVAALVDHGKPEEFLRRGRTQVADPLFLSRQTLSAALNNQFFSRIVWILPPPAKDEQIPPDSLRSKLTQTGILSETEAAALTFANGLYQGTLQGLPFQVTATGPLPQLDGPVVLHFDFDFFSFQYRNEIVTPIFSLLQGTLIALRQTGWHTLAVTFAINTEEGEFPLELRFVKNLLAEIFANPKRLDEGLSEVWALRKDAMYAETFFQGEAILDHYLHMEELRPKDASVKYDIYRAMTMVKEKEEALIYLDEAISLDRGYAFEYIKLSNTALSKDRSAEALAYLKKAQRLLPHNPFVRIQTVNVMLRMGMHQEAGALVRELQALPWSEVYYPNIPESLKEMAETARGGPVK